MALSKCDYRQISTWRGGLSSRRALAVRATLMRPLSSRQQSAGAPPEREQDSKSQHQAPLPQQPVDVLHTLPFARPPFRRPGEVMAMILGGGPGTDLWPLTNSRAEPAVPFAGLFRLIDVPLSNCIHSGVRQIYVLTQYNSTSLNRHLSRSYGFLANEMFSGNGFVETLAASQRPGMESADAWYKGTADAVRRYLYLLDEAKHSDVEDVLVLAGDQLYRMDYAALLNHHRATGADATIATTPADEDHATHLGVLKVDKAMNVLEFTEKPPLSVLATMSVDTLELGFVDSAEEATCKPYVASMGMYVFKRTVLQDLLARSYPQAKDFSDILARVVGQMKICAYAHHGYWEDVGSLSAYYAANMALAADTSRLQLFDRDLPLYSEARVLPPSVLRGARVADSLVGDACRVDKGSVVRNSVLGSCTYVERDCYIEDCIIFGADTIDPSEIRAAELAAGTTPLGIGAGSVLKRAVVDSNARIGRNCKLTNAEGVMHGANTRLPAGVVIRDGLLVVMRDAALPPGTVV